jgi:ribonuclease HII
VRSCGFKTVAGVDEAGRGPLAGPVVAAAVIFLDGKCPPGVTDSKLLKPEERETAFAALIECVEWAVGAATVEEIDRMNILRASQEAMRRAIAALPLRPDFLLIDGLSVPFMPAPQRHIVKGELQSASIAAASIIAKVTRDRMMVDFHQRYPQYGFDRHKGYYTRDHRRALSDHGPCCIHRRSFLPVQESLDFERGLPVTQEH